MDKQKAYKYLRIGVAIVSSFIFAVAISVAIAFVIQSRNDSVLSARIAQSESELRAVGPQIAAIKDHRFGTMSEYIDAYERIEPLLTDYDRKLHEYGGLRIAARQRDQKRRLTT